VTQAGGRQGPALPAWGRLALAVSGGLLSALAFPPWDYGLLAFVGLVPLLLGLDGAAGREAAWLGYSWGLAFYLATVWWVINTMTTYGKMPLGLSIVALALMCGVLAAYPAAFAWLQWAGRERLALPRAVLPVVAALLWTGLELLRTYLFSGFPWLLFGTSQYREPSVRLLAALAGVYGISLLLVLVNASLAELILAWLTPGQGRRAWRHSLVPVGLSVLALCGTFLYARLGWHDPARGPALRVALLQGNIDQSLKWDRAYQTATLEIYERLTRQAAAERPDLVVWPETALPFLLRGEPELGRRVLELAAELHVPLLVGSPDLRDGLFYNSAFLIGADGRIEGRYDKQHLVPFGEYVPLHWLFFFLDKLVVGIGDFGRGQRASVLQVDGARFGVMICYEVIFPAEVRAFVRGGAQFLVNITNDAWFGRSGAPYQHLAMAAMRAVENGTYLVRAANTGVSAIIAPSGEILAATDLFTRQALSGTIRLRQEETLYTRTGDLLAWACAAFLAAYLAAVAATAATGKRAMKQH
jgi:apolipoprotein N-acyltransferase